MFDNLYVLAKEGVCVYSGTPGNLQYFLQESYIIGAEYQLPIEALITLASKGCADERVEELRSKTSSKLKERIERRNDETKPKQIKRQKKLFNFKDVYYLICRGISELFSYKWKSSLFSLFVLLGCLLMVCYAFRDDIGEFSDCFAMNEYKPMSCMDLVVGDHNVEQNITFLILAFYICFIVKGLITMSEKIVKLRIFTNEHQNS